MRQVTYVAILVSLFWIASLVFGAITYAAPSGQRVTPTPIPPTSTATTVASSTPIPTSTATTKPTAASTPTASLTATAMTSDTPSPDTSPTPTATPDDDDESEDGDNKSDSDSSTSDGSSCLSRVEGFVVDQNNARLAGQIVQLSGNDWSTTWTTDSNGFFYFNGLCAGELTVAVLLNGQSTGQMPVRVNGDADTVAQVTLRAGGAAIQPTPASSATPAATAQPTATLQVVQRLPQTGSSTFVFLVSATLFALVMIVVGSLRRLRHT